MPWIYTSTLEKSQILNNNNKMWIHTDFSGQYTWILHRNLCKILLCERGLTILKTTHNMHIYMVLYDTVQERTLDFLKGRVFLLEI